jgi:hypothetical protein
MTMSHQAERKRKKKTPYNAEFGLMAWEGPVNQLRLKTHGPLKNRNKQDKAQKKFKNSLREPSTNLYI